MILCSLVIKTNKSIQTMDNPPSAVSDLDRAKNSRLNTAATLIAFSHLRWSGVFQRPQHLLGRLAKTNDVIIWEEPEFDEAIETPWVCPGPKRKNC